MAIRAKSLASGQLASSTGTLYTVPTSNRTVVKKFSISNTSGSDVTVNIYVTMDGLSPVLITPKDMTIKTGHLIDIVDTETLILSENDLIRGVASTGSVIDYLITGVEETGS